MKKRVVLCLILVLVASSLFCLSRSLASSNNLPIPEFTLRNAAYPYDVLPTTTSTTDPYTGKVTTTATPGYHVENKTVEAVIKNNGASYYNFRYKGHFEEKWRYDPFNPEIGYYLGDSFGVPFQASSSSITVLSLYFFQWLSIPENGSVDVQVQALFGKFDATPYGHVIDVGGPTYDFKFEGTTSDWSSTQTITIGANASSSTSGTSPSTMPSSSPDSSSLPSEDSTSTTTPNQSVNETPFEPIFYGIVAATAIVLVAGLSVLVYVKKRRGQSRMNVFCYEML